MSTLEDGDVYSLEEKIDILFKSSYDLSSTGIDKEYYQEDFTNAKRKFILPSQIWADDIPANAPAMQYTDAQAILGSTNPIPGVTTPIDYSYIKRYLTMEMKNVGYAENAFILSELKDSIPFTQDSGGSYIGELYRNDGTTKIPFGPSGGNWKIDHNTGILTFFDFATVSSYVNAANPPKITFYRYEGTTGLIAGITQAPNLITNIFDGGDTSGVADTLSAVIVDSRDLGGFASNQYSMTFNIGGYFNGSWRIGVRGGGGNPDNTSLVFQKRKSGTWETIHELK